MFASEYFFHVVFPSKTEVGPGHDLAMIVFGLGRRESLGAIKNSAVFLHDLVMPRSLVAGVVVAALRIPAAETYEMLGTDPVEND